MAVTKAPTQAPTNVPTQLPTETPTYTSPPNKAPTKSGQNSAPTDASPPVKVSATIEVTGVDEAGLVADEDKQNALKTGFAEVANVRTTTVSITKIGNTTIQTRRLQSDKLAIVFSVEAPSEQAAESLQRKITTITPESITASMKAAGADVTVVSPPTAIIITSAPTKAPTLSEGNPEEYIWVTETPEWGTGVIIALSVALFLAVFSFVVFVCNLYNHRQGDSEVLVESSHLSVTGESAQKKPCPVPFGSTEAVLATGPVPVGSAEAEADLGLDLDLGAV